MTHLVNRKLYFLNPWQKIGCEFKPHIELEFVKIYHIEKTRYFFKKPCPRFLSFSWGGHVFSETDFFVKNLEKKTLKVKLKTAGMKGEKRETNFLPVEGERMKR